MINHALSFGEAHFFMQKCGVYYDVENFCKCLDRWVWLWYNEQK